MTTTTTDRCTSCGIARSGLVHNATANGHAFVAGPDGRPTGLAIADAYAVALVDALREHLTKWPVRMDDLGTLCGVLGITASEIARRAEKVSEVQS